MSVNTYQQPHCICQEIFPHFPLFCSNLLSVAVKKNVKYATWGGKGSSHLTGHSALQREVKTESQGKNLEARAATETMEEQCLLFCLLLLAQLAFSYKPEAPTKGWHFPQCSGPSHINNQQNSSQTCPQVELVGATLQLRFPLSSHA